MCRQLASQRQVAHAGSQTLPKHRSDDIPILVCIAKVLYTLQQDQHFSSHIFCQLQLAAAASARIDSFPCQYTDSCQTVGRSMATATTPQPESLRLQCGYFAAHCCRKLVCTKKEKVYTVRRDGETLDKLWRPVVCTNKSECGLLSTGSMYFQMKDFTLTTLDPLQEIQWPLLERLQADGWNCIHLSAEDQKCRWPSCLH